MKNSGLSLTNKNISAWLEELDDKMKALHGLSNYSSKMSKEEWIAEYEYSLTNAVLDDYNQSVGEPEIKSERILEAMPIVETSTEVPKVVITKETNITEGTTFFKWFFSNKKIWAVLGVWIFIHVMIFTHFSEYFYEMTPGQTTFITSIFDIGITLLLIGGLVKWFKAKHNASK